MPLDDKEQRILEEIERQFYEEDPDLARAVKRIEKPSRIGLKLSIVGLIAGLAVVIAYVAVNTWIAVAGFALLVASATSVVNTLRARDWRRSEEEASEELPE